jgi:arginyl-tRNA synthetase
MFASETLPRLLIPYINDRKDAYGTDVLVGLRDLSSPNLGRKKVIVEFSSPNIASEFHGKHLRSTLLGAYIANQYENMGCNVVRINYLGDWGKQIALLGAGWERFGSEEKFEADPVGHMLDVYNQINALFQPELVASRAARDNGGDTAAIEAQGLFAGRNAFFKRMEDGDEETLALWKRFRESSIKHYVQLYARLNVNFDEYAGEAQVNPETMDEVEDILKSKGITEESEGSLIVDLKKHTGKPGRVIIRDRNGSRTYHLRELATAIDRSRKHTFDKMIYVVANDHDMHFVRIIKILKLMDMSDLADKLQHVHFNKGVDRLDHGHMLGEILGHYQSAMHESLKASPEKATLLGNSDDSAAAIGISALLAQELQVKRVADHHLDIEKATSFGRGTGPELQYWYRKLCDMLKSAEFNLSAFSEEDFNPIEEETYMELLRILAQYPNITTSAYKTLEPSTIMLYLITITDQLPFCIETEEEVQSKADFTPAEAALFETVRQVLENGMKLLGIRPAAT